MRATIRVGLMNRVNDTSDSNGPTHLNGANGTAVNDVANAGSRWGAAQQADAPDEARNLVGRRPMSPYLHLSRASQVIRGVGRTLEPLSVIDLPAGGHHARA